MRSCLLVLGLLVAPAAHAADSGAVPLACERLAGLVDAGFETSAVVRIIEGHATEAGAGECLRDLGVDDVIVEAAAAREVAPILPALPERSRRFGRSTRMAWRGLGLVGGGTLGYALGAAAWSVPIAALGAIAVLGGFGVLLAAAVVYAQEVAEARPTGQWAAAEPIPARRTPAQPFAAAPTRRRFALPSETAR